MMEMDHKNEDRVDEKRDLDEDYVYGRWGPYQTLQAAFMLFHLWSLSFQMLMGVFIAFRPRFECAPSANVNHSLYNESNYVIHENCQIKLYHNDTNGFELKSVQGCTHGYKYVLDKESTIVTEFDLICDKSSLAELLQTLVMAGQMVGATCASSLSDRMGRKIVHLWSNLLTFIFGFGVGFAPNYTTLALIKFMLGVFQQGMMMSSSVFGIELFPQKTRYIYELIGSFFWTTGLVILSALAYLLRDYSWRYLQITLSCFSLLSLIQYWVQDESLRWLIVNGKTKEVDRILHKVAKWNKLNYGELKKNVTRKIKFSSTEKPDVEESLLENVNKSITVEKYSILTILRTKSVLRITILMCFTWIANSLTYFGLTLTATSLAGNRFLNFFFMACVEYISLALEFFMLKRFGRRTATIFFHTFTGSSLAIATLLNYFSGRNETLKMLSKIATFAGKMSVTGSFSVLLLFTQELYPTNLRNVGIGVCSTFSRIGAIISPFAGLLALYIPWAPGTIFASVCFIVSILTLYLPETRGMDLLQTLDKAWYAEHSGFRIKKGRKKNKLESEIAMVYTKESRS